MSETPRTEELQERIIKMLNHFDNAPKGTQELVVVVVAEQIMLAYLGLETELTTAKERIRGLEDVLRFYAKEWHRVVTEDKTVDGVVLNSDDYMCPTNALWGDHGQRARAVMGK